MMTLTKIGRGRLLAVAIVVLALVALAAVISSQRTHRTPSASQQVAFSPSLDPGTALSGPAANFTLTDQYDRPVSLSDFRGKVVLLAFNDAQCTTVCPLTTTVMADAKRMLGRAG
ncbi:MAG: SCO family protein, partial [Candidatus Dormibacteria bacterium]